jgi:adenine phosphoribosyltransferase
MSVERLIEAIRDVPDFPKPGIIFKDITPLLAHADLFKLTIDTFAAHLEGREIDKVAVIDARGFIFGSALAYRLGAGVVPIRKQGKLPFDTIEESYELEYGTATLAMHVDAVEKGEKILLMDDLLATGGTAAATASLISQLGGEIVEIVFLIELAFLKGREKLADYDVFSAITF